MGSFDWEEEGERHTTIPLDRGGHQNGLAAVSLGTLISEPYLGGIQLHIGVFLPSQGDEYTYHCCREPGG